MPHTRVDDLEIVWDVAGPESGEPVVMINGLGAARGSWSLQVAAMAERYRVFTFDNRDVGETGAGKRPRPYGMERFARDTAGLIETLELGAVHVVGASMGGTIAQELGLLRPDLVRTVQIVCSWPGRDPWLNALIAEWDSMFAAMGPVAWARNSWQWVFTYRWYRDAAKMATLAADAEAYPYPQTPQMFGRQCQAAISFDARDRLGEITAPVQVIVGAEDIFTPPRFSEEIAAAIPGAGLTILPEVGHGMFWETPDAFNSALLRFLEAHRA